MKLVKINTNPVLLLSFFAILLFTACGSGGKQGPAATGGDLLKTGDSAVSADTMHPVATPAENTEANTAAGKTAEPAPAKNPTASVSVENKDDWKIPDHYKMMKDPVVADQAALDQGKALYNKHCKSCHGAKGAGDGPKAASLKTPMRPFSAPEVKAQKPGVLYYKSIIGRDEMPNYETKIPGESDRWALVEYLSTL